VKSNGAQIGHAILALCFCVLALWNAASTARALQGKRRKKKLAAQLAELSTSEGHKKAPLSSPRRTLTSQAKSMTLLRNASKTDLTQLAALAEAQEAAAAAAKQSSSVSKKRA
jgi:hypothetical protein